MTNKTGLSGIREHAQGFVGRWIKYDTTQNHKPRLRFDLACGKTDEAAGKLVTWRHCIVYGDIAVKLQNIKAGDLVSVSGWVTTEKVSKVGEPQASKEYLILFSGELINRENSTDFQLSFTAGQNS